MRRIFHVFCSLVILCCFSACDPTNHNIYEYDELVRESERVELIWYNNLEAKEYLNIKKSELRPFDFEKMDLLETLPEEKKNSFLFSLADMTKMFFKKGGRVMDSPSGLCIRLVYKSGDFEIFVADDEKDSPGYCYAGSFFENGEVKRFIGTNMGSSALIDEYFPEFREG